MRHRLPSLPALRAFDAASRAENFTRAAEELLLTQSAVSRHIRTLEGDLGVSLFIRKGRQMILTDEGMRLKGVVGQAFDTLADGIEALRKRSVRPSLTISLLPSLAAKWLVRWIGEFSASFPELDLNVHCSRALVDFEREKVDAAIRYGRGEWRGCSAELLLREEITVVCSPELRERMGEDAKPDILSQMPLLYGDEPDNWIAWMRAADCPDVPLPKGPVFTDGNAIIQAAIDGQGVLLGRSVLVAGDIAAGKLVEPFDIRMPASYDYYFVTPEGRPDSPILEHLRAFILSKAAQEPG